MSVAEQDALGTCLAIDDGALIERGVQGSIPHAVTAVAAGSRAHGDHDSIVISYQTHTDEPIGSGEPRLDLSRRALRNKNPGATVDQLAVARPTRSTPRRDR